MTHDDVVRLFTHMEWADAEIWKAVNATDAARHDPVVMERLHHVHVVQRIYLQMWLGNPDRGRELSTFADLAEVRAWAHGYYEELRDFLDSLDDRTLAGLVRFPWADELEKWFGEARPATVGETMLQVAIHTSHHRGQLCTLIREHGGQPPLVDFVAWIWMGKPGPAWDDA